MYMYMYVYTCMYISRLKTSVSPPPQGHMQITWDSPEELEEYVGRLKTAAEHLTSQNRRLRRSHSLLVGRVSSLMPVDLLRQPQRWKDTLMEIRHMMASLVQVGRGRGRGRR